MVAFQSATAANETTSMTDEQKRLAIINSMMQDLAQELAFLDTYRNYYDGEQSLVFGEEKFVQEFGTAFAELRANWCATVVDAVADRLEIEGLSFEGDDSGTLANDIWDIFRDNDIDQQADELHEAALVEGRAAVIVWPDEELGARVDWQPAQNIYVRYSDDDWRVPVAALKRWVNADDDVLVTFYTRDFVYKYVQRKETGRKAGPNTLATVPDSGPEGGLIERRVDNEPWPLPNPLGVVPVVEFANKDYKSELHNVIPIQDAINYLLISSLGASGYAALNQWVLFSASPEPTEGWIPAPGRVWQVPVTLDADGKPMPNSMDVFPGSDLNQFRSLIDMSLQHAALISKTPVRMFFHSDRGGRGDAPSGESLIVDDEPLLDKVEKRQTRFGNSWLRVARLVAQAAKVTTPDPLRGEPRWKDPRAKFRSLLLAEASQMWEIGKIKTGETRVGIPLEYIVGQLALPPDDVEAIRASMETQKTEQEAKEAEQEAAKADLQQQQLDIAKTAAERPQASPPSGGGSSPSPRPSNR